jgi:LysM repeat protein
MRNLITTCILLLCISISAFGQNRQVHIVSSGETLFAISRTLDVTVAELRSWNNLTSDALAVGQELVYFIAEEEQAEVTEPPQDFGESLISVSTPHENEYYTVKSGDNLTTIARAHEMTLSELRELNNLSGDLLRIGQQLAVRKVRDSVAPSASEYSDENAPQGSFVIYTVEENEELVDILEKFEMTTSELQQLNPEVNINSLDRNQRITVLIPPSSNFENPYTFKANLQDLGAFSASVYPNNEVGNTTTSGELYNPNQLTAAHSNITIGSILFVENPESGAGIYVRINDRITESGLKLSSSAYRILGLENSSNPSVLIFTEN